MVRQDILIVDDDMALNTMLAMHLQDAGYGVAGARTCREALYLLQQRTFDAALLDYQLPDGNGLELLEAARELAPRTGFVLITGAHDPALRRAALEGGAVAMLRKPISLAALDATVAGLVRRPPAGSGGYLRALPAT